MAGLIINPRARIFHGHDWVYASDIKKSFGKPEPGDVVTLKDFKDRPLGCAIYNPASQIVARRISRRVQKLDQDFFTRRIQRAVESRKNLGLSADAPQRVVWSESDGLPGVVIDRYGEHIVLQTLTLAMDNHKPALVAALVEVFSPASIIERNDSPVRRAEGMELVTGVLHGTDPGTIELSDGTVSFSTSFLEGQKTGLYLDQFDNYRAVAAHAAGLKVLDLFTNQGGFALHAAKAGAASVKAIDISEPATAATTANAKLNGLADIEVETANVFDHLKHLTSLDPDQRQSYDLIVLDPPSFTRAKKNLRDALRGYKEIHLRSLQLLKPGGLLATFCCSHHVTHADFRGAVCAASVDAKKSLRELETYRQRPDHPVVPTIPETEYLKGYLYQVTAAF